MSAEFAEYDVEKDIATLRDHDLTPIQEAFVGYFMINFDRREAAKKLRPELSDSRAYAWGTSMLQKPGVRDHINMLRDAIFGDRMDEAARVYREYKRMAFFDPRSLFDSNGDIKKIEDMTDVELAGIVKINVEYGESAEGDEFKKVQLCLQDKKASLDSLSKILGLQQDGINTQAMDALASLVNQINGATVGPPSERIIPGSGRDGSGDRAGSAPDPESNT